jgi:hypothetical protein
VFYLNNKEFEALHQRPANIRYEYFIKKVVDFEEVWGLYNEGWATAQDDDGNMLIPFFPKKEFAVNCAKNVWEGFEAEAIDLYEFIDEWLVGMKKDGVKPSIFPTEQDTTLVEIDVLLRDIYSELENY